MIDSTGSFLVMCVIVVFIALVGCFGWGHQVGGNNTLREIIMSCEKDNAYLDKNLLIQCQVAHNKRAVA